MVGHQIDGRNGINQEAAQRLFNLLNCLLLAEKRPVTVSMLEEAFLEVILKIFRIFEIFLTFRWRVQQCPTTSLVSQAGFNLLLLGLTGPGSGGFQDI